jgi:hypothetical protein
MRCFSNEKKHTELILRYIQQILIYQLMLKKLTAKNVFISAMESTYRPYL